MPENTDIPAEFGPLIKRFMLHEREASELPTLGEARLAHAELSAFVLDRAEETASELGFKWVGSHRPPQTYSDLLEQYVECVFHGTPLPVSNQDLARSIFTSVSASLAMRYWQAIGHIRYQYRDFNVPDEIDLGLKLVGIAEKAGVSRLAVVYLEAEIVGQTLLVAATGKRSIDPFAFDSDVIVFGVADAICLEVERRG